MAFDPTFRTTQEYLNQKAGTVGRTKQECLLILANRPSAVNSVIIRQDAANSYAGTTGLLLQDAMNVKAGTTGSTLTKQEAARRL